MPSLRRGESRPRCFSESPPADSRAEDALSPIVTDTLPDVSSSVAVLSGVAQTFQNTTTFSATSVTVGSSTAASTLGLGTGATTSGVTKAVNIGTAGVSGSTTNVTIGSAKFDLKGAGSAIFGKMSMQDFGSRGTVAVGGTTATSGTASDVPTSGGALASVATSAALRASIHGTFEITTAGTIIPSIALDVAAAAVLNAGSYFECIYLGPAAALGGSWS